MIDGVTSRPFSAKTLPPISKSGDKKIEEEVIKSSRALYCRSKEDVEREINDWSGMSLGNDTDTGSGSIEKFPAICSNCGKETTVPFKPEPGRPVYCKDCIAKIKSGEIKVEKRSENQIKHDEATFFQPLADLGIEFQQRDRGKIEERERYPGRVEKHINKPYTPADKPGILGAIKKVFVKPARPPERSGAGGSNTSAPIKAQIPKKPVKENAALREILNKVISKSPPGIALRANQPNQPLAEKADLPEPVSLDTLKNKAKESMPSKDRAASSLDMTKLKDLISSKIPPPTSFSQPQLKADQSMAEKAKASPVGGLPSGVAPRASQPKEVPEDVLRKILE